MVRRAARAELFLQIAEDHVALVRVAQRPRQEPFGENRGLGPPKRSSRDPGAKATHWSDSSPFHRRISASREALSARTAAGVTVK